MSTLWPVRDAVSGLQDAMSLERAARSRRKAAVTEQPAAVTEERAAVTRQPAAVTSQRAALSRVKDAPSHDGEELMSKGRSHPHAPYALPRAAAEWDENEHCNRLDALASGFSRACGRVWRQLFQRRG